MTINLKIKIDNNALRQDIENTVSEIESKLQGVDQVHIQTDAEQAEQSVKKVDQAVKQTNRSADHTRQAFAQWGMVVTGIKSAIDLTKQALGQIEHYLQLSENQELAVKRLNLAFATSGELTAEQAQIATKDFSAWASEMQKVTNYGDEVTLKAAALGQQLMSLSKDGLKTVTQAAMDLSSAFDQDLQTSMRMIANTAESGIAPFRGASKEMMDMIRTAESSKERLDIALSFIQQKFGGTAQTMKSEIASTKNTFSDTGETIGKLLNNTFSPLLKIINDIFMGFNNLGPSLQALTITIIGATTAAVAFSTSLGGIPLIIGAIVTALSGAIALISGMKEEVDLVGTSVLNVKDSIKQVADEYSKLTNEQLQNEYFKKYKTLTDALLASNNQLTQSAHKSGITLKEYATRIGALEYDFNGTKYYIELSDKATQSIVTQYEAILQIINARNTGNNTTKQSIELQKLELQTKEEGRSKELMQLKLWYIEQKEQHKNNKEALKLIDEIYSLERNKINTKFRQREKRAEEKLLEDIQSLKQKTVQDAQTKELAQLQSWYKKKSQEHKKSEEYQDQLTETYSRLRQQIIEKYNDKKIESEQKKNQAILSELNKSINLELQAYQTQEVNKFQIADKTFQLQKQLLDENHQYGLITEEEYQNRLQIIREERLQAYKEQIQAVSDLLIDTTIDHFTQQKQYSDAEVEYRRLQFDKEQESLEEQLANGTISREEYILKMKMLDQDRADFQQQVENQNQSLLQKIWSASHKFALSLLIQFLKEYTAKKLAELFITESTETAKTTATETGTLARVALFVVEIAKKLALAAVSIFEGIASAVGELFSALGPFALLVVPAFVAGAYGIWTGLQSMFGFKEGGYTGDGDENEEAGKVHKGEYVFTAQMVGKEKSNFDILYKYMQSGGSLQKLYSRLAQAISPNKVPLSATPAIAGFPISNYTNQQTQQDSSILKKIEEAISNIPDKLNIEATTKIGDKEIWLSFKRRDKIEQKRTSSN